jgi:vitamin B12 transporter
MPTGLDTRRPRTRAAGTRRLRRTLYPLTALVALAAGTARADSPDALQQVVVTATRVPTPQLDVGSSITVISADDIETRQERTFADVLKDVPGLNVVQTGGAGGVTSVFMRGTNSNHTKTFIDGIDVSDPSNSGAVFDYGQLLTQDIERVEVLRGPQSGLYGADAIGGVINIITRSGAGPAQFNAAAEGGSFDTFNQWGNVGGSLQGFSYNANVDHFHAGATPVTPLDLLLPGEARNDDYDDNLTFSTKLGYQFTPDFDVGVVARYSDIHLHTTGEYYEFEPPYAGYPAPAQTTAAIDFYAARVFAHLKSFEGVLDQTVSFAYSHERTDTLDPSTLPALNTGDRRKADWQGDIHLASTATVVLGAEYERDQIEEPLEASVHIGSGYAELQSQLGEHFFSALNVRYDDNSLFGSKVTYRFAPAWVISDSDTKLKASIGSGFKAPTLSQLFQNFPPYFYANPNLQPETSVGWDAGFEQGVAAGAVRFGATYFHNRIRNLIDSNDTDTSYANIGKATTEGVESFIEAHPFRQLSVRLDYTYTEATDDILDQELLRRPKHKGNLIATWQPFAAFKLNVDLLTLGGWVDGNRDFSIPRLDAPGYTTVNLAASYALNTHLTLMARIDNLFDRHYQIPVGFLGPAFAAYGGIKLQF